LRTMITQLHIAYFSS